MKTSKPTPPRQSAGPGTDEHGRITEAARMLGGLTLLSRLAGLVRDLVIAAFFGTSTAADAFFVAFRIPNLFRRIVAEGAASTAFVPVFTSYRVSQGDRSAGRAAAAVGGAAFIVLLGLVMVGVFLSDSVVSLFAPGFAAIPAKRALTADLVRWTFPYLFLVGMAAWAMGVLHTFRRFVAPAVGPILLNISIVSAAVLLVGRLDQPVYALAVGVLIGGCLQFFVQAPSLRAVGIRLGEVFSFRHPAVPRVGRLLVPTIFGGAVYQLGILVATILASLLPDRSVSYLWYADRIFEFPLGIVAVAVGTAALPSLSSQATGKQYEAMAASVSYALRLVWTLCMPAMVGLWVLAPAIVEVLFQRGHFTTHDTAMTAWALRAYAFGMLGVASSRVLVAIFYAIERPRIPVLVAVTALLVNALFDIALMGPTNPEAPWWGASIVAWLGSHVGLADMDHAGLALGTAIGATVNAALLFVVAWRWLGSSLGSRMLVAAGRHAFCTGVMICAVVAWQRVIAPTAAWVELSGGVVVGTVVYVGACLVARSEEMREILSLPVSKRSGE